MSPEETKHPVQWRRLGQLHGQIMSLTRSLDVMLPAGHHETGSGWLPQAIASITSEVASLVPDKRYFRCLESARLEVKSPLAVAPVLKTRLEMRSILGLAAAAIEDACADQPQEPFGFARK